MNRKMDKNLTVHRHYTYEINQKIDFTVLTRCEVERNTAEKLHRVNMKF